MAKKARKVPEIPSSSLADIAFLLLIFFLTSTSMDTDKGLERRLPQWVDPSTVDDSDAPPVKERNVFVVLVDRENRLMVEGELCRVEDLKEKTKVFLTNPSNSANLPEKEVRSFLHRKSVHSPQVDKEDGERERNRHPDLSLCASALTHPWPPA